MTGFNDRQRQTGFTLVEAVVTIVITAILSVGIINYIGDSVEGFASAVSRNQLASSGRVVVDRMSLELSNGVPNSVRTTEPDTSGNQCLEFVPFEALTPYIDLPDTGQGDTSFEVVQFNPDFQLASPASGYYAIAYPNDVDEVYGTDGGLRNRSPVAELDSIEAPGASAPSDQQTVYLTERHRFPRRSPAERLFVSTEPVSFCVVGQYLYRYNDYGFQSTQCEPGTCLPDTAGGGRHLVADNISNANRRAFTVTEPDLRRNAIISLDLNFTEAGENVRLIHDVLSRNVP